MAQDLYVAGYFCHPLRGILSMRETLAEYDFRAWMDPSLSLKQKGLHRECRPEAAVQALYQLYNDYK